VNGSGLADRERIDMSKGTDFTTAIEVRPSYDHREESHNKGCGSAQLVLILRGPLAVVTTTIITDWMARPLVEPYLAVKGTPTPWARRDEPGADAGRGTTPMAAGTSIHATTPLQDWWTDGGACPYLDGAACYGDTGYTTSDPIWAVLVGKGSAAAFARMQEIYASWTTVEPAEVKS
jgi:hypothetical protein